MTEDEILREADRIRRRRNFEKEINTGFARRVQVICFDGIHDRERFDLHTTCLGFIKAHLLAKFDQTNPPYGGSDQHEQDPRAGGVIKAKMNGKPLEDCVSVRQVEASSPDQPPVFVAEVVARGANGEALSVDGRILLNVIYGDIELVE